MMLPLKIGSAVWVETESGWYAGQVCDYQQTALGLLFVVMLMTGDIYMTHTVDKRQTTRSLGER